MTRVVRIRGEDIEIRPIRPETREIMRKICNALGLPAACPFKSCRRTKRCATAEVLCYRVIRKHINTLIMPIVRARRDGTPMPPWPASDEDWQAVFDGRWPESAAPDKLDGL